MQKGAKREMAQWIPKNAWRVNNLNRRYGVGEIGLHVKGGPKYPAPFLVSNTRPSRASFGRVELEGARSEGEESSAKVQSPIDVATLMAAGVPLIDVRDTSETVRFPVDGATPLHHHDLLSGACNEILPRSKEAEMVVFADTQQRALNALKALQRWGYCNIAVMDYNAVQRSLRKKEKAAK